MIKKIIIILFLIFVPFKIYAVDTWKNYYGIEWRDSATNTVRYAKSMGYDYIVVSHVFSAENIAFYKNNPDCAGMKFYLIDPHFYEGAGAPVPTTSWSYFNGNYGTFTQQRKDFINSFMAYRYPNSGTTTIPTCLAPSWPSGVDNKLTWDWQCDSVINKVVADIMYVATTYESDPGDAAHPFTFAGCTFDTASLEGEIWQSGVGGVNISVYTGTGSTILYGTHTRDYNSHENARAKFFERLKGSMTAYSADTKLILQPSRTYHAIWLEEVVRHNTGRSDWSLIKPDFMAQEDAGIEIIQDTNIYAAGNA